MSDVTFFLVGICRSLHLAHFEIVSPTPTLSTDTCVWNCIYIRETTNSSNDLEMLFTNEDHADLVLRSLAQHITYATACDAADQAADKPQKLAVSNRWKVVLPEPTQTSVILCDLVNKPNPLGRSLLRQLILTDKGLCYYVDPSELSAKGVITLKNAHKSPTFRVVRNPFSLAE